MSAAGIDLVFDVDGVFNAFPPMSSRAGMPRWELNWGWDCEPIEVEVMGFPITYSGALVARVHALVDRPDVDAYWLTTWCEQAPTDLCPGIGLRGEGWPVLGLPERQAFRTQEWWKFTAIRKHLEATDRRIVWIDDDLAGERDAQEWVHKVNIEAEGRLLGLAPETHNGLTLAHLDLIEHWIKTGEVVDLPALDRIAGDA